MDMSAFQKLLAPKDVVAISFKRKDNFHGIGYSGIDPLTAMFGGTSSQNKQSFKPTGKEKKTWHLLLRTKVLACETISLCETYERNKSLSKLKTQGNLQRVAISKP